MLSLAGFNTFNMIYFIIIYDKSVYSGLLFGFTV